MNLVNKADALRNINLYINKGAYEEAQKYSETLPGEAISDPEFIIAIYRAALLQGNIIRAHEILSEVEIATWSPSWQLIHILEHSFVQLYRYGNIREAMETANTAVDKYKEQLSGFWELAEAERIHVRILLTAATYRIINIHQEQEALDRLPEIIKTLFKAGRITEAIAANLTYAERQSDLITRLNLLDLIIEDAISLGLPAKAAEASLIKAEQMLKADFSDQDISVASKIASEHYNKTEHIHGPTDVDRVNALLAIRNSHSGEDQLQACLSNYQRISFYRGQTMVLMDLSQHAHNHGDTSKAIEYRGQMISLTEKTGMGLTKDSITTAQVDLLMRNADYGGAIALCKTTIASGVPDMTRAGYELLLASAYSFVDDYISSCEHGKTSIEIYQSVGAEDAASDAVVKLASDLNGIAKEESWETAETLLTEWVQKDSDRNDFAAAVSKLEMLAQIKINRFNKADKNFAILDEADTIIKDAEELASRITGKESVRRIGSLYQLSGQIFAAKNDENGMADTWRKAMQIFIDGELNFEVANCQYILGTISLNRANRELQPHFGEAETNFNKALNYYDAALMRERAADTRFFLARLYVNAALQVYNLREQLLEAALQHLGNAELDFDAIRREFNPTNNILETQQGKQALIKKSQRIYNLALEITCAISPNAIAAWDWTQRSKARALTDMLGVSSVIPLGVMSEIEQFPDSHQLVLQEQRLRSKINLVSGAEQTILLQELEKVSNIIKEDINLQEYVALRTGRAISSADLEEMVQQDISAGGPIVCVDWISAGDKLFVLVAKPGQAVQLFPLSIRLSEVVEFVNRFMSKEAFRSNLKSIPDLFRQLDDLIAPLHQTTSPGELLVLSPTGPLSALPLHILEIENMPLLVRNPVAYCPALSVLRQCISRRYFPDQIRVALFGDPNTNLNKAGDLVEQLAKMFNTKPLLRDAVNKVAFRAAISGMDIIHFQGHAQHSSAEPLDSHLLLSDGKFTAKDVFDLSSLHATLVTLAACESGVSAIVAGDEPLGLIPAFLYAGANSVLATLWKVNQDSAARVMERFYKALLPEGGSIQQKAEALRVAALSVRDLPGFESQYYWAAFVLYGDWN